MIASLMQRARWRKITWKTLLCLLYGGLFALLAFIPGSSVLDRLRWLDSGICAQLPTHSFSVLGQRLPLCARNTGIYLGFLVTLLVLHGAGRGKAQQLPRWSIILVLACGVGVMVIDGFNSLVNDLGMPHLYQPNNILRLATGLTAGLGLACAALPVFNSNCWREYNEQRSVSSGWPLVLLATALVIGFVAVITQSAFFLYPVALLSTAGLILAIAILNLMLVIVISKHDQSFQRYRDLLPFFTLALLLALGEMLTLAELKYVLFRALGM